MPKIGQNRSESVFYVLLFLLSGRSGNPYGWVGDLVCIRETPGQSGRVGIYCIILVDLQPRYLPEAGRFICNRISLNGVDCSTTLYFSLLENNNFNTCIMLMIIFEN